MKELKKHLSIIIMAAMLLMLAFAAPLPGGSEAARGAVETASAASTQELLTVSDIYYSSSDYRVKVSDLGRYFYINNNKKLCMSNKKTSKGTVIGFAREAEYIATDGKKVYFTDVSYDAKSDSYTSRIRVYDIKAKTLKTLRTFKNRYIPGIYAAHNKLFCYSGEVYYAQQSMLRVYRDGKTKTLIKGIFPLEEGFIKGSYKVMVQENRTGAKNGEIYYKATEINCKTEEKRTILSGRELFYRPKTALGDSFVHAKESSDKDEITLKVFNWNTGKYRTIGKYDPKGDFMTFEYSPAEKVMYGMTTRDTLKGGSIKPTEYTYKDVTVFTVDLKMGVKKDIATYENVVFPYLSTVTVNMAEEPYTWDYETYVSLQFNKHDNAGTAVRYVYKGEKGYYLGETDAEIAAFEKEFGGRDPSFI